MKRHVLIILALMFVAMSMSAQNASDYRADAERGDMEAQYELGLCYRAGDGVAENPSLAFNWIYKSANQGYVKAQLLIGAYYSIGYGVEKNLTKSAYWVRKAAEQGNAQAQWGLGECYRNGEGVEIDDSQSVYWYQKAAQQGLSYAQNSLGKCYKVGRGVDQDYAKALYWLSKAANQGIDESYYQLGMMYELGQGVTKNEDNALLLYEKASQIYDEKSIKSRMNENENYLCARRTFTLKSNGHSASKATISLNSLGNNNNYVQSPYAEILNVTQEHNVVINGKRGVKFNITFNVFNMKDKEISLLCYIWYDNNDQKFLNPNSPCKTNGDDQVCEYVVYTPTLDGVRYNGSSIFIPYDCFNILTEKTKLKAQIRVYDTHGKKFLENKTTYSYFVWK
jgi:hypothetical protein